MSQLSFRNYVIDNHVNPKFDILDYLRVCGYHSDDQSNVETNIKDTIDDLYKNPGSSDSVIEFCSNFMEGEYRIFRNASYVKYWDEKRLVDYKKDNERKRAQEAIENSRSKRVKTVSEINTIATRIKTYALEIYHNKVYNTLDDGRKNVISNGLNSLLDLSNERNTKYTQRNLFTRKEWQQMKENFSPELKWKALEPDVTKELEQIEKSADSNLEKAYKDCLELQQENAWTQKEMFFQVYCHIINIIHDNPEWLYLTNKTLSECDYSIKVWGFIFEKILKDNQLELKWGDTVPVYSTETKTTQHGKERKKIGDKIDFRVVDKVDDIDLINGEIASVTDPHKYFQDDRKIIREGKNMNDYFYRSPYLTTTQKESVKATCIQIMGTEGEITSLRLVDDGLYVNNYLGSLRLPSGEADLKNVRVLIERLLDVKRWALKHLKLLRKIRKEKEAAKKGISIKKNATRSPYGAGKKEDDEEEEEDEKKEVDMGKWVRGSWYSPPKNSKARFNGDLPKYFTTPPPPLQ